MILYTTSAFHCPYCVRAKAALTEHGYRFDERDIGDPVIKSELLEKRPTARTIPQVFYPNGVYLGDCDELLRLIKSNSLALLVEMNTPEGEPNT
jgi:glutaredoxin 3